MRDLGNLNKEHDKKQENILQLGSEVYTVKGYRIGRKKIVEIINRQSVNGTVIEYTLENPFGQKELFNSDAGKIFKTFEEAKESSLADWNETDKQVRQQILKMTEEEFNKEIEKQKQQNEAKSKFKQNQK